MQITLRKASALQNAIVGFLAGQVVPTKVSITKFEDPIPALEAAQANASQHIEARLQLIKIQFELRRSVGEANVKEINGLLADRAFISKTIEFFQGLLNPASTTPAPEVFAGKFKALLEPVNVETRRYTLTGEGGENLTVGLITPAAMLVFANRIGELKRAKTSVEDALLSLNITTKIEFPDEDLALLKKLNIA
jgi:hypothetical protein